MKRLIIALSFASGPLLFVSTASQASSNYHGLSRLLKAKSSIQFSRILLDEKKFERLRLVCEAQLRASRIPEACFELVHVVRTRPDLAWGIDSYKIKDESWLDDLCASRAESSKDWRELKRAAASRWLRGNCRRVAIKRKGDLLYADQAERPVEVFFRRLPVR